MCKGRTLDLAAPNADTLLDWYLALASLLPASEEPLLSEDDLRTRIALFLTSLPPDGQGNTIGYIAPTLCQRLRVCFARCLRCCGGAAAIRKARPTETVQV